MSELVDYERAASKYDRGRALPDDSMARWQAAVAPLLPAGPLRRVVDVGAGTGCSCRCGVLLAPTRSSLSSRRLRCGTRPRPPGPGPFQQWAGAGVDPSDEFHEEHRWVDGEIYLFIDDADLDEREHGQFRWFRSSDNINEDQSQPDPATLLELLRPAGDFEEMGTETIDGVETRRLRAVTPEETPPLPLGAYGNQMGEHSLGEVTDLEVWVGDNGIVRRIDVVVRAEFPASSLIEGDVPVTRTSSSSIRFYDIGEPITIQAPPDAGNLSEFP